MSRSSSLSRSEPYLDFLLHAQLSVSEFEHFKFNQCHSERKVLTHNDVALTFALNIYPKGANAFAGAKNSSPKSKDHWKAYPKHCSIFIRYINGPDTTVPVKYRIWLLKNGIRKPLIDRLSSQIFDAGSITNNSWGYAAKLPNDVRLLAAHGFLDEQDTLLHVEAELLIPESAFVLSGRQYEVVKSQSLIDPHIRLEFDLIAKRRIRLFSKDGQEFFIAKERLDSAAIDIKELCTVCSKPRSQRKVADICHLVDMSSLALHELLRWLYLKETSSQLGQIAQELYRVAGRLELYALQLKCQHEFIAQLTDPNVSAEGVLELLEFSHLDGLPDVENHCLKWLLLHWGDICDDGQLQWLLQGRHGKAINSKILRFFAKCSTSSD